MLEVAARRDFAVILLDVMMPGMNGFDTLERLRKLPRTQKTPVIFLTAKSLEVRGFERAYVPGAVDYLNKPILPELLRSKVDAYIALFCGTPRSRGRPRRCEPRTEMAVLAHDVRNPLSVIAAAAALLTQHDDPKVQTSAARVSRAAKRIQSLAEDLLEHARRTAGNTGIREAPMDLAAVCQSLLDDFEITYPHVKFSRTLSPTLPGVWDEARPHQAISNLLTNAVKHGAGWVSLSAFAQQDLVSVTGWRTSARS